MFVPHVVGHCEEEEEGEEEEGEEEEEEGEEEVVEEEEGGGEEAMALAMGSTKTLHSITHHRTRGREGKEEMRKYFGK